MQGALLVGRIHIVTNPFKHETPIRKQLCRAKGAHCGAALSVRVFVDHVGKLFKRINADNFSIIKKLSAQEILACHFSQRVFAHATET